jgi:hypothetical protein
VLLIDALNNALQLKTPTLLFWGLLQLMGHLKCVVLFLLQSMREEWKMGHDPFAEWVGDKDDICLNCGDGRQYPYGLTCLFKGKEVPCYCTCSESGSTNGKILTDMLRHLDNLGIFNRSTGLNPFLLLDGHGSRFELDFLEYINNDETKWCVNIGLPYGTSYWQVGDSTEKNGCFKMALTRLKQKLVTKKMTTTYHMKSTKQMLSSW